VGHFRRTQTRKSGTLRVSTPQVPPLEVFSYGGLHSGYRQNTITSDSVMRQVPRLAQQVVRFRPRPVQARLLSAMLQVTAD
jgi:hypothetical protein